MKRNSKLALAFLLLSPGLAWAAGEHESAEPVGESTRQLLEMQRSGSHASKTARPHSEDISRRSYQRYTDTFSYSIPESFSDEQQEFIQD